MELLWYVFIFLVSVLVILAYIIFAFKHKVIINEITTDGSPNIRYFDRAREYTDKEKVPYWVCLRARIGGAKLKFEVPTDNKFIDVTKKGKKCIEVDAASDGSVTYVSNKREQEKGKKITTKETFSPNQRHDLAMQLKKAADRRKLDWRQNLPAIIMGGGFFMFMIIIVIFWGDMMQPLLSMQSTQAGILDKIDLIVGNLNQIIMQEQLIKGSQRASIQQQPPD